MTSAATLFAGIIGFAVFGYLTAALASFFVGREKLEHAAVSGGQDDRLATLQASIDRLTAQLEKQTAGEGPDQQQPSADPLPLSRHRLLRSSEEVSCEEDGGGGTRD